MKKVYESELAVAYETEKGARVVIQRDFNAQYYNLWVKESGKKGKTIATRCTYDYAYSKAKEF